MAGLLASRVVGGIDELRFLMSAPSLHDMLGVLADLSGMANNPREFLPAGCAKITADLVRRREQHAANGVNDTVGGVDVAGLDERVVHVGATERAVNAR